MTIEADLLDTVVAPEPGGIELVGAEAIPVEEAEASLWALDDLDLHAAGLTTLHAGMLQIAIGQYRQGVVEQPLGSNRGVPLTRYVQWFAPRSGPVPWCAYFVSWCLDRATDSNRRVPWTNPGYVGSVKAWAAGAGRLVSRPQQGDIFGLSDQHIGIVNNASAGAGQITTIEGNFSDKVAAVRRSTSGLWFARI